MTDQLKPCPFCGGAANHASRANDNNSGWQNDVDHWIYCAGEDCLADMGMCETKDEAVRLWNARDPEAKCKQSGDTSERVAKEIWGILVGDLQWEDYPQCHMEYRMAARAAIAAMQKDAAMDALVAEGQRCDAMTPQEAAPDWEGFGRAMLEHWPVRDVDGAELFDLSLKYGLIAEVPGGYDPEQHIDAEGISPETGDPWYEYTFRAISEDSQ